LSDVVNRVKSHGKNVGIYASRYMWQSIFGSFTSCSSVGSHPLWYAHYDNSPSFSDFQSFGGWTKPHAKQYQGDTTLCGAGVDKNYI
jgi:GH25 family lysozyme M1 (1,4-beta-N-acetylmuramidase)